jgi:hypothetical protein
MLSHFRAPGLHDASADVDGDVAALIRNRSALLATNPPTEIALRQTRLSAAAGYAGAPA